MTGRRLFQLQNWEISRKFDLLQFFRKTVDIFILHS